MRRAILPMVIAIGLIVPAGHVAEANATQSFITLVGKRTSFVDVRFHERFRLDDWATQIDFDGTYGGWLIHPLGRPLSYEKGDFDGAYVISDVHPADDEDPTLFTVTIPERTFAPGLYRVYLLADGPTKIRIPIVDGARSKTIRPVRRTSARWTAKDIPLAAPGVVNGSASQPIRVTHDAMTFSTLYLSADEGATVQDVHTCLRKSSGEAAPGQNCEEGWFGYVLHPQQDYVFTLNYVYPPGALASAKYYTFAEARAASVNRVMGVGFTVQLHGV